MLMGTPLYLSPEQCRGGGVVDPKSDAYSFGVMLYQLLAGHPPFSAVRVPKLLSMHPTEEPPRLDEAVPLRPPELVEFVHRMLLKDPAQRPAMREVVAELERMQAQRGSASAQSLAPPAPARRPEGIEGPDDREDRRDSAPRSERPAAARWERPYSDGRTEGAGDLGQGIVGAYEHTLSSGPHPRSAQHASSVAQSSGLHTAPGTGERTPVPPRPHARWRLFLASLLGGLVVAAAGFVRRPAPQGMAPEPHPKALSVAAAPAEAPLRTLPPAPAMPAPAHRTALGVTVVGTAVAGGVGAYARGGPDVSGLPATNLTFSLSIKN